MQKFNGSLIRQFPSLVTGNAAAGVNVSVYIEGTTTLATLYATDNTAGAQLSNPLTTDSKGFYSFYAADGKYTLSYSNGFPDQNINLIDANDLVSEFNTAMLSTGWILVDAGFTDGYTITQRNEALKHNSEYYRWDGALPKTVPALSSPATTGGIGSGAWLSVGDAALRSELAASDSTVLVGGVEAGDVATRSKEAINVKSYGATGDGVTDDTLAIQAALDAAGVVVFPAGLFITNRLHVRSNTVIWLHSNTEIRAKSGTYDWFHCVFNMDDISNVAIYGNNAKIRMLRGEYPLQEVINGNLINSEYRHCVKIYGSSNIGIDQLQCYDAGGDGFTIGGNNVCRNIVVKNCIGDNNRRQGVSVTNAIGCWINGGEYRNTNGLPPERGIDIEPNALAGYFMQNVHVNGVTTRNNAGGAVLVAPNAAPTEAPPVSVFVTKCTSIGDGAVSGSAFSAIAAGTGTLLEQLGEVIFEDNVAIEPKGCGMIINRWNSTMPRLIIRRPITINPAQNPPGNLDLFKTGISIRHEPDDTVGNYYGKIEIHDPQVYDDRITGGMSPTYAPIFINNANAANEGVKDILIKNVKTSRAAASWGSGQKLDVIVSTTPIEDYRVLYDEPFELVEGSQTVGLNTIGATIVATVSSTYTLPTCASRLGSSYLFRHDGANANLVITPNAADTILGYSAFTGGQIIARRRGAKIKLTATANGWLASDVSGQWATTVFVPDRYPNSATTAAPTTGTWESGDRVWNSAPSAGAYAGWICTSSGAPGTWKGFGLIET